MKLRYPKLTVAAVILGVLIVLRAIAPPIVLSKLNNFLKDFSPTYAVHIQDLDFAIWRGAYRFENLTVKLKSSDHVFAEIDSVSVSVAWRALLQGKILTDILVSGGKFELTKNLIAGTQGKVDETKVDAKAAAEELFPLRVSRVLLRDSTFEVAELIGAPKEQRWRITGIDGWITNLTPTERLPLTQFALRGTMLDSSMFKLAGEAKKLAEPIAWNADVELKDFDLVKANAWLKKLVPFTFTTGRLDLYVEAKSEQGHLTGYVKPFLKKVQVLNGKDDFVGVKHFAFEIVGALTNLILRKSDDKTVAARIPFYTQAGALKVETTEIIPSAVAHGFGDPLPKRLDNTLELKNKQKAN